MRLFEQRDRQPRHDLGQNFLVDLNLLDMIVRQASLKPADVVLEIGTGTGGLTAQLAEHAGRVISVEFDEHVYGHARNLLADRPNVQLLHCDALASKHTIAPVVIEAIEEGLQAVAAQEQSACSPADLDEDGTDADNPWRLRPAQPTLKLVANLPYNIATPVMSNLVASDLPWSLMVVTIQFELAERMLAPPKCGDYSALTVWLQAQAKLKLIRKLPPSVFWPPPNVDSAVLKLERWPEGQARIDNRPAFQNLVREVFTLRRKQILGILTQLCSDNQPAADTEASPAEPAGSVREELNTLLASLGIKPTHRPEQITVDEFVRLSNALNKHRLLPQAYRQTP